MTPLLTVFTPTYNRAHLLPRLYESLLRQTSRDFLWLVIDDGSSDGTDALVKGWMEEGRLPIHYCFKENGGMHTAHNAAYEVIDTELNTCIDSDDWMPEDAVAKITAFWREHGSDHYVGILALDATEDGHVIGTRLPEDRAALRLCDFYAKGGKGDKKLVYRTEVMRKLPPYPVFPGEKYVSLAYKYRLADECHPLLVLNEVVCCVEYQPEGSSRNIFCQYWANPNGFAFIRRMDMVYGCTARHRFRAAIHYVAKSLMLRNGRFLKESPRKLMTLAAIPFGIALYLYLLRTKRTAPARAFIGPKA